MKRATGLLAIIAASALSALAFAQSQETPEEEASAAAAEAGAVDDGYVDLRRARPITGNAAAGQAKSELCATCHGPKLQGLENVPALAGRSPSYLLRQLLSFQHGLRVNEAGKVMQPVVEKLELADMVAIAAYLGSLYPQ